MLHPKYTLALATGSLLGLLGLLATLPASAGHLNVVAEADLSGRNEVAPSAKDNRIVGDPNGGGEAYVFGIDGDAFTLCYLLVDVGKIAELDQSPGSGRAAHIHRGAPGANGPVVANLAWPQDGQAADCLTEGEAGKFPGDPAGIVAEILTNPERFYVNLHNNEYPGGAIRGQLENVQDHAH